VIKAQVELDKLSDRLRTLQDFKHPLVARLNAAMAAGEPCGDNRKE